MVPGNTPVIIGVGQFAESPGGAAYKGLSPVELAAAALKAALSDSSATRAFAAEIDIIAAIRQFEISTPVAEAPFGCSNNLPRSIAKRVGANPKRAILEISGGQGPQKLVGELAGEIASGRSSIAAIVGSEAISTTRDLQKRGVSADWSEHVDGDLEDRGYGVDGLVDKTMSRHGLIGAIPGYALFDNARRARLGESAAQYRNSMGKLFSPFTQIASQNPFAAAPVRRTMEALATVTADNRIVAEPYPRLMVAREQVNQAAALILCSAARARELGIPEGHWVHIHGVSNATELSPLKRPDLSQSPAALMATSRSLELAGISIAEMDYIDLYSCFAIAVFNIIDGFSLTPNDPRGFTVTGGLPFFGGPGNNYSTHAIAETVQKLRQKPGSWGLVGANGGLLSKYSTGIYSTKAASWSDISSRTDSLLPVTGGLTVLDQATGPAKVESYTIIPKKSGDLGVVVAQLDTNHERVVAVTEASEPMDALRSGVPFSRNINITAGADGRNFFVFES